MAKTKATTKTSGKGRTASSAKAKPVKKSPAKKAVPKKPAVSKKAKPKTVAKPPVKAKPKTAAKKPVPKTKAKPVAVKSKTKPSAKPAPKPRPKPLEKAAVKAVKATKEAAREAVREAKAASKSTAKPTPGLRPASVAKPSPVPGLRAIEIPGKVTAPVKPVPVVVVPTATVRKPAAAKPLPREFLFGLADAIRTAVLPAVRAVKGREVVGSSTSGDVTFEIDRIAERALLNHLKDAKAPVAYYSEDAGYTTFASGQPQYLLVVDPIDGTRAAKSGFESCVVSVGCTRVIERPRIGDIETACVMEILHDRVFYAERGKGTRVYTAETNKKPTLSSNTNLETMAWSMTVPARPAELVFPTAAKLIDITSLKGGFFACNSTSYSLTRLLTNQLDACVDFANRYLRDIPEAVEDWFINAGRGMVLGIAPYDIAASLLIAREAGCTVTDAYGQSLDDVLLLDSSVGNHRSLIAASNAELHQKLLSFFDTRIRQFETLLSRRAAVKPTA